MKTKTSVRLISVFILTAVILSSTLVFSASAAKYPSEYWDWHAKYEAIYPQFNDACKVYEKSLSNADLEKTIAYGDALLKTALPIFKTLEPYGNEFMSNLTFKYKAVYYAYQLKQDYKNAVKYIDKYIAGLKYLESKGDNYKDALRLANAKRKHIDINTEVYAETPQSSHIPYYNAILEPKIGINMGRTNKEDKGGIPFSTDEKIRMFYFHFGTEKLADFNWRIKDNDGEGRIIVFAWNAPGENDDLKKVNSGKYDQWIIDDLKYINSLKSPTMLRIFTEMNVWKNLAEPKEYVKAFQRIAKLARQYAPKTALIFAPNGSSNWNVDISDYYPGDEYVDWVGISMYTKKYFDPTKSTPQPDSSEAYYNNGLYANPIMKIKDIVDRYGDRKPIMISEGATGYESLNGKIDLTDFAVKTNATLYNYISMIYPQVKAIIYFDLQFVTEGYNFKLEGNSAVKDGYFKNLKTNVSVNRVGKDAKMTYRALSTDKVSAVMDTLNLSTYAVFPTTKNTEVKYKLNGTTIKTTTSIPYKASIKASDLKAGEKYKLDVIITNGSYTETKKYYVTKSSSGAITCVRR